MVVVMSKAGTCVTKVLDESPSSMGTLCNMNSIPDFSSPEVVDEEVEAGPQNTAVSRWLRGNGLMLAEVMHLFKYMWLCAISQWVCLHTKQDIACDL